MTDENSNVTAINKAEQHIEKLEAALAAAEAPNAPADLVNKAALQFDDFSHYVTPHLFQSTLEVLKNHVPGIKDRHYEVKYMGIRGPSTQLFEAGKRLADKINEACGAFRVVGILGKPIKFDINPNPDTPNAPLESVFLAYIAYSPEAALVIDKLIQLDKSTVFFVPGGVPSN